MSRRVAPGSPVKHWAILCPDCGGLWFTTDWDLRGRRLRCPGGCGGAADGDTR